MTLTLLARRYGSAAAIVLVSAVPAMAQPAPAPQLATGPRTVVVADVDRIATVRGPQRSPDGQWVAYSVSTVDVAKDKSDTDVWMVKWDGSERVRLTSSGESEASALWSPDGKWLSFLRQDEKKKAQVWTLSRLGGEAQKLTNVPGGVTDYR